MWDIKFTWQFIMGVVMATSIQYWNYNVKFTAFYLCWNYNVASTLYRICKEHQMFTIHYCMVESSQLCLKFLKKLIMTWHLSDTCRVNIEILNSGHFLNNDKLESYSLNLSKNFPILDFLSNFKTTAF